MKYTILFTLATFYFGITSAQVPLAEVEGVLSVFLLDDTTSLHIGRQVGVSQSSSNNENTVVGAEAGGNNSDFSNSSFFGYRAGYYADTYSNSFFGAYSGENTGQSNSGGCCNSFFGLESGKRNDSGSENSIFGQYAGSYNVSGNYNSFYGSYAGEHNNGNYNSYFGNGAGEAALEGNYNSFFGNQTGNYNEGDYNNYFGNKAGYWNNNGSRNIAIGSFSLYQARQKSDNVAVGDSAMYGIGIINENTFSGQRNVAIGTRAFYGVDSEFGKNSVAIGYESGMDGGQRSVFLGYQAGKNITDIDDVLYINNTSGDAPLIYGEFDNDFLRINGNQEIKGDDFQFRINNPGSGGNTWRIGSSNSDWAIGGGKLAIGNGGSSNNAHFFINSLGYIGIGVPNPSVALDIDGEVKIGALAGSGTRDIAVDATGQIVISLSDQRLKKNINVLQGSLAKIKQLRGVSYEWKEGDNPTLTYGLIAQEVLDVLPEVVTTHNGYYGINYSELPAILIEAIKEQQSIIEKQQDQLNYQSQEMQEIKAQLSEIKDLIVTAPPKLNSSKNETEE